MFSLLVLSLAVAALASTNSSSIGSCRDATNRLVAGRKLVKKVAAKLEDAFVGLAEQYNRDFPDHSISFPNWLLGYKDSMLRSYEVDILNLTAVQLSSQFTFMYQAWARTARITLCNSDELNQLEALFDGLLKGDNALLALKTSFYNDRFGYVQIPYSNGAGFGFGVLINFDNQILAALNGNL